MTAPPSATAARDALLFVVGVNDIGTFQQRLMQSPCLQPGGWPVIAHVGARSAAEAFNGAMDGTARAAGVRWLVWVHQDVVLPVGWDVRFLAALAEATGSTTSWCTQTSQRTPAARAVPSIAPLNASAAER
ncbi:hypothetical protein, partial [uncultured Xylophilus sp.]|uniref:hypothetical protein n=1 Tax=uncultured Xylophilus sp. TaxID=296832 RepID=UPI0025D27D8E